LQVRLALFFDSVELKTKEIFKSRSKCAWIRLFGGSNFMMRTIKIIAVLVVLAGGYVGYAFWGDLTPGEKHHIKDGAKNAVKTGDFKRVGESVSNKMKDKAQTQKSRLEQKSSDIQKQLKKSVHDAAQKVVENTEELKPVTKTP
jgi:hypothetical protein